MLVAYPTTLINSFAAAGVAKLFGRGEVVVGEVCCLISYRVRQAVCRLRGRCARRVETALRDPAGEHRVESAGGLLREGPFDRHLLLLQVEHRMIV